MIGRSPRDLLASDDAETRRVARRAAANRIRICGWDAERAWTTPIGPRGRPRVRPVGPVRGRGRPSRPEPTWEEVADLVEEHPDGMRLDEIAAVLGTCPERVRQIEASALAKVARALASSRSEIADHLMQRGESAEAAE